MFRGVKDHFKRKGALQSSQDLPVPFHHDLPSPLPLPAVSQMEEMFDPGVFFARNPEIRKDGKTFFRPPFYPFSPRSYHLSGRRKEGIEIVSGGGENSYFTSENLQVSFPLWISMDAGNRR
jgi:hypothetical protein